MNIRTKFLHLFIILSVGALAGCNTLGGMLSGAGQDLSKAGEWVKSK